MAILQISDFDNGSTAIPTNPNQEADLQLMIDYVEAYYLPRMFGVELNDLFLADLVGGVPTSPRFVYVFDAFTDQSNTAIISSDGIKAMLKGLVYFHYGREQQTRITTVGAKQVNSENSENRSSIQHDYMQRYNCSIGDYKAIQHYMSEINAADYPEYKGVSMPYDHPF